MGMDNGRLSTTSYGIADADFELFPLSKVEAIVNYSTRP